MSFKVLKVDGVVPLADDQVEDLLSIGASVIDHPCSREDELVAHAADADAILTISEPFSERVIARLERCRVISRFGIGVDNIDIDAATRAGIYVTNVPDFCVDEVSDHAIAMLLALSRRLAALDAAVREGRWDTMAVAGSVTRLRGQVLGLVGFGRTARLVAKKADALGLSVLAHDPYVVKRDFADYGVHSVGLTELFSKSDYVSVHAPLTEETRRVVNAETLALMQPSAFLVNVSRGGLVDEAALADALTRGTIAGAGLDVFEREPLPRESRLREMSNVVLSSHAAYYSNEALTELRARAVDEVVRVLGGNEPTNAVNPGIVARATTRAATAEPNGGGAA